MNRNLFVSFVVLLATGLFTVLTVAAGEPQTDIFIATPAGVMAFSSASSEATAVLGESAVGIAYDSSAGKIYASWGYVIRRANVDGSGAETVFNWNAYSGLRGMSLDSSTGKLYILTNEGYVLLCNTTSATSFINCAPLLQVQGAVFEGNLALDTRSDTMYFTSYNTGRIYKAKMDGSGVEAIYASTASLVGITIDVVNSKLYWAEYSANRIMSSDLQGQNVHTVVQLPSGSEPYGIVKLGDRLYWGNFGSYTLQSCDSSGLDIRTHFTHKSRIYHLAVAGINLNETRYDNETTF